MYTVRSSTTVANVTDLRRNSKELFSRIRKGGRVLIQKNTDPLAVLVDHEEYGDLVEAQERLAKVEMLMRAYFRNQRIESGREEPISHEEMLARLGLEEEENAAAAAVR